MRQQPPTNQNKPASGNPSKALGARGVPRQGGTEFEGLLEDAGLPSDAGSSRADILKMLERRERDAEELDLESCFSEMRSKVAGADQAAIEQDIESLASESMRRADQEGPRVPASAGRRGENASATNIYKPQIRTPSMRSKHSQNANNVKPGSQLGVADRGTPNDRPKAIMPPNMATDWKG